MAGGPSTPALVTAAARAGGLGFLAAGYKTPEAVAGQIAEVRGAGVPFGVNVFAPNPVPAEPGAYRRYAEALRPEADRYGLDLPSGDPVEDDDHWDAKVALLLADPVPVVSFTFGFPEPRVIAALRRAGLPGRADRDVGGRGPRGRRGRRGPADRAGIRSGGPLGHADPAAHPAAGPAHHADRPGPGRDHGAAAGGRRAGPARRRRRGGPCRGGRRGRRHRPAPRRRERRFPGAPGRPGRTSPRDDRHPRVHRTACPGPAQHVHRPLRRRSPRGLPGDPPPDHPAAPRRGGGRRRRAAAPVAGTAYRHATAEPAGRILARLASGL